MTDYYSGSPFIPLPADWVSPTLGKIPPGGVAPGEALSPHCHDRPAEMPPAHHLAALAVHPELAEQIQAQRDVRRAVLAVEPKSLIDAIDTAVADKSTERCRCVWYRHTLDTGGAPKRMWMCPAQQHDEVPAAGSYTFEDVSLRPGWLWRLLDRLFGGDR